MPRKRTQKNYFGEAQEQAVIRFLESESEEERNKIFKEYLEEPLIIMVESIIRRYKLYRKGISFNDQHTDTMSFLMTKTSKFDPSKNKKAYSYFIKDINENNRHFQFYLFDIHVRGKIMNEYNERSEAYKNSLAEPKLDLNNHLNDSSPPVSQIYVNNKDIQQPQQPKRYSVEDNVTIFGKLQTQIDPDLKICPYCNSKIKKLWSTCPICGKDL